MTDIKALMIDMRDLAERIIECQGENSEGEEIIHLYDQSDTTFKAENILLVLGALEAERQRADANDAEWRAQEERAEKAEAELAEHRGTQEPVALVTDKFIAYLPKQGDGERWPVGTKLYAHPVMPVINLNHIGRITAQISGQRYTYFSAEDVRHYFEEMKCEIVERAASSGDTVYIPHQELPKPVVVLPKLHFGVVQGGHAVMIPYSGGHWLNKTAVIESLEAAGIVVKDGE